ncbi:MAG: hypothetical protein V3U79_03655 [Dehalococcoidia bacterium]
MHGDTPIKEWLEQAQGRRPGDYLPIFTIPVYLRSRRQYYEEHSDQVHRKIEEMHPRRKKSVEEVNKWLEDHPESTDGLLWPYWEFSDIVGYIEILYSKGSFRGQLYGLNRKRINRDPRHRRGIFVYQFKVGEAYVRSSKPSESDLRQSIEELIADIKITLETKYPNRRYVDWEYWHGVVKALDFPLYITAQSSVSHWLPASFRV